MLPLSYDERRTFAFRAYAAHALHTTWHRQRAAAPAAGLPDLNIKQSLSMVNLYYVALFRAMEAGKDINRAAIEAQNATGVSATVFRDIERSYIDDRYKFSDREVDAKRAAYLVSYTLPAGDHVTMVENLHRACEVSSYLVAIRARYISSIRVNFKEYILHKYGHAFNWTWRDRDKCYTPTGAPVLEARVAPPRPYDDLVVMPRSSKEDRQRAADVLRRAPGCQSVDIVGDQLFVHWRDWQSYKTFIDAMIASATVVNPGAPAMAAAMAS